MNALAFQDIAKPGTRWSKAAIGAIVQRFKQIKARSGGSLTAALVLADARDEASPLHRYFEWDDSRAAESWRLEQARKLIQQHYVIVTVGDEEPLRPVRAHVVVEMPSGDRGYLATVAVMNDEDMTAQVMVRARLEMSAWIDRYERFAQLSDAVTAARKVLEQLAG